MSNTYFQFKHFKIEQAACANKVSTDACVFGAYVSKMAANKTILDVGCGSALLCLMSAQGGAKKIVGVEIESNCAEQALENVKASQWANLINIVNCDIHDYKAEEKFDFIISNPPFFNNSSKNPNSNRNLARQTESLGPESWPKILDNNLSEKGVCAFLLSNNDVLAKYKEILSQVPYAFMKEIMLFDKNDVACKRVILFVSKEDFGLAFAPNLVYKDVDDHYSNEMISLLNNFYLYL